WNTGGGSSRTPEAEAGNDAAVPEQGASFDADHDGHTIMKSDLRGMTAHPAPAVVQDAGPAGPLVLARVCGQGHANPPTHAQCAACGLPLPSDAVQVARPRLGRMRVSTGELVDLDQSLVIGRQPSVSRVQGGVMPRLVQVASPSGDISRSHVEVRLEGWHVMLCDLKATNGTVLVRGGQQPRRLAQNEMAILLDGDIAELGDDISLRFEEIL
nr:FHA domain-containing protein [Actinomycetota bacterium]